MRPALIHRAHALFGTFNVTLARRHGRDVPAGLADAQRCCRSIRTGTVRNHHNGSCRDGESRCPTVRSEKNPRATARGSASNKTTTRCKPIARSVFSTRSPASSTSAAAMCSSPRRRPIRLTDASYCRRAKAKLRLGLDKHPLGPPADPGLCKPREVYDAILTGKPYPVKALVLVRQRSVCSATATRCAAKRRWKRSTSTFTSTRRINPSATFADLLLPANTCWEHEALLPFFEIAEDTMNWAQLRPAVAKPVGESRSDAEIIFDLAKRLGLAEQFFDGDYRRRMEPSIGAVGNHRTSN